MVQNTFILIAETATNQDIQAAERRLPSIGNSCIVPLTTIITSTMSIPTTSVYISLTSTRDGDRQLATTLPIGSDDISSSPITEESSDDATDGQFLSLSLLELILVVVIVAVVVISISVVTGLACCWWLYMKRVQTINNTCNSKGNDNNI